MKRIGRIAGAALAACLVTAATAAYADVLILRSVGPSASRYKAGQRLPDNARLVLRPGDNVSILRPGGTRVFRGPGSYSVNAAAAPSGPGRRGGRISTAAVRGPGPSGVTWPPDLWQVDASVAGGACYVSGSPVTLWRQNTRGPAALSVTTKGGTTTRLAWPARQATLRLPLGASLEGARISYSAGRFSRPIQITLAELKLDPANRDAVGAALLGRGCHYQLLHFIALNEERAP